LALTEIRKTRLAIYGSLAAVAKQPREAGFVALKRKLAGPFQPTYSQQARAVMISLCHGAI
jgi:hypothetical protein